MFLGAYLKDGLITMDVKTILGHGMSYVRKKQKLHKPITIAVTLNRPLYGF